MKKILLSLGLVLTFVLTFAVAPVNAATECTHENLKFQYYLEGQTKPKNCLQEAVAKFKCDDCDKVVYQKVSGEHNYAVAVEDATCTTPQRIVEKCSYCNDIKTEEVLSPALGHDWDETHIDATCTKPAGVAKKCKNCDAVEDFVAYPEGSTAYQPAKGHKYGGKTIVAPTCSSKGYTLEVCSVCEYENKTNETAINPEAHKAVLVSTIKEATCTEDGVGKYVCEYCEETLTYTAIPAAHKWGDPVANKGEEPTCGEAGKGIVKCTVCYESKDVVMPATGDHSYRIDTEKSYGANCGKTGLVVERCDFCGDEKETVLPIQGEHDYEEVPYDADCTKPAGVIEICKACGGKGNYYAVDGSEALGHDWNYTYYPATCEHASGYTAICKRKGCTGALTFTEFKETDEAYKPALEHKYGKSIVVEATCQEGGYTYQECSVCHHIEKTNETEINPNNHIAELVGDPLKAPTCTVAGVGKYQCKYCEVSLGYKSIAASHTWNEGIVTTVATCTEEGVKTYTCTVEGCGATKTEAIAKVDHDYKVDNEKSKANDCGHAGLRVEVCTVCKDEKTTELPATGLHNFVDTDGVNDADCENPQTVGEKCLVCGKPGTVYPVEGSTALGHILVQKEVEATCEHPSGYYKECSRVGCDHKTEIVYYTEGEKGYVAALGHKWDTVVVKATCQTKGSSKDVCERCEKIQNETELPIDPNNHAEKLEVVLKEATCTTAGVGKYVCKNDKCKYSTYKTIPAAHTWDEGTISTSATCTKEGVKTYTCTVKGCKATKSETVAKIPHSYVKDTNLSSDADCGHTGKNVEICSVCKDKKETKIAATGKHSFVEGAIDADCENPQRVGEKCSICGTVGTKSEPVQGSQALGHDYQRTEFDATCESASGYVDKCSRCDKEIKHVYTADEEGYVAALGHKWNTVVVKATCQAKGSSKDVCERCGKTQNETELPIDPNNHDEKLEVVLKEATCTTAGVGKYVCKNDKCKYSTYKTIPAAHTWDEGTISTSATCTKEGVKTYTCTVKGCKATKSETVAKIPHSYVKDTNLSSDADCGHTGKNVEICSVCKDEKETVLPIAGKHNYVEGVKDATCTSPAKVGIICSVCKDEKETVEVQGSKALGHDLTKVEVKATCTTAAGYYEKCSRKDCDYKTEVVYYAEGEEGYIAALGHDYEEVRVEATCQTKGSSKMVCSNCNDVQNEIELPINPNNHKEKLVLDTDDQPLKAPTCTTAGVGKYVCENAKCNYSTYKTIPAQHSYGSVDVTKTATCAEAGEGTKTCTVCGHKEEVVIPATGKHNIVEDVTPATCAEAGLKVTLCLDCDYKVEEVIPATGKHNYVEGVKDATCTSPAKVGIICSVCKDEKETVVVEGSEALGHDWNEVLAAADCTHAAGVIRTCSRCDIEPERIDFDVDSPLYGAALGHEWETVIVAATCKKTGTSKEVCKVCKATQNETTLEIDSNNHNEKLDVELKAATCTVAGVGKYVCQDCKATTYKTIAAQHKWESEQIITPATCGKAGEARHKCTICQKVEKYAIAATEEHDLTTTTTQPTCSEAGAEVTTCANCDYKVSKPIPATGKHSYVEDVIPATCTEAPMIGFVCSICAKVDPTRNPEPVEDGKPLGHDLKETHIDATCTTPAGYSTVCTRCDYEVEFTAYPEDSGVYEAALGHNYKEVVKEGYCNQKGYTASVCANCGDIQNKVETEINANNHVFEEPVILKAATCTTAGVGKYTCYYCDYVEYKSIEAKHTWSEVDKVNADATVVYNTCTVEGCEAIGVVSCIKFAGFDGKEYSSLAKVEEEIAAIEDSIIKFASVEAIVTYEDEAELVLTISTNSSLKGYEGAWVQVNGVKVEANAEGKFVYSVEKPEADTTYSVCYATEIAGQLVLAKIKVVEYKVAE